MMKTSKLKVDKSKNYGFLDKLKERKEYIILAIMAAVIFAFGTYQLFEIGQPVIFDDELGYWANSSFFMGQDWSSIASSISYYSYGYSLLLVPIRLLTKWIGWNWRQMYEAVVVMQSLMLVAGFFIAIRLSKRYLSDFHWLIRDVACFTVMLYPTYIVYTHIAWTETLLAVLVWLFLYVMMRLVDKPTMLNHVCFALLSFYMYTVHQRCLAAVAVASLIVLYMRLLKENRLNQTAAFMGTLYLYHLVHIMIKKKLQNDFYLAQEPADWHDTLGYVFNKNSLIVLLVLAACLAGLYFVEKGWGRIILCLVLVSFVAGGIVLKLNIEDIQNSANSVTERIAKNDFSGQINKLLSLFTVQGVLQLLISITGKWFYLASATGLVICFGIWHMGKHAALMAWDGGKRLWSTLCKRSCISDGALHAHKKEDIWFLGAFLLWLGVFAINALYIMRIDRIIDLLYGRYHEIAAGFLILYGFYCLIKDKKWIRHMILFVTVYLLAGWLCQHQLDKLGSTSFELCHSVMMGRSFVNGETTDGRIWKLVEYSSSIGIIICILVKAQWKRLPKAILYLRVVPLIAGVCIWAHMGTAIVKDYVIAINYSQQKELPTIATWINRLSQGEPVYFLKDTRYYRWGLALQYDLFDQEMIMDNYGNVPHGEEAFYVAGVAFGRDAEMLKEYALVADTGSFTLLVPKDGAIYERLTAYEAMQ